MSKPNKSFPRIDSSVFASLIFFLGLVALFLTHSVFLSSVPGFHYDEAWAALFSHRIAAESGFWPIQAMSPYTSAWSHYIAAAYFWIFGTSLQIYRLSAISCVLLGIFGLARGLNNVQESRSAMILPWLLAFFPALVFNHRFAIEINTFHVLCLGGLFWALNSQTKLKEIWICGFVFLGITSHVLFIAPTLALWITSQLTFAQQKARSFPRLVTLLGLLAFFLKILLNIPEHDKSLGLLLIIGFCIALEWRPSRNLENRFQRIPPPFRSRLLWVLMAPALLLLAFFMEGSWNALFFSSKIHRELAGWFLLPVLLILWKGKTVFSEPRTRPLLTWFSLTLLLCLILATKPAPRYFEVPLLMAAILLALAWSRCSHKIQALSLAAWCGLGGAQLQLNYFGPILGHEVRQRDFHFLVFRDSSNDTLPKQEIAQTLGSLGCPLDQIQDAGPRLMDPLKFLSQGDWPLSKPTCDLGQSKIIVQPNEANAAGGAYVFLTQLRK